MMTQVEVASSVQAEARGLAPALPALVALVVLVSVALARARE